MYSEILAVEKQVTNRVALHMSGKPLILSLGDTITQDIVEEATFTDYTGALFDTIVAIVGSISLALALGLLGLCILNIYACDLLEDIVSVISVNFASKIANLTLKGNIVKILLLLALGILCITGLLKSILFEIMVFAVSAAKTVT